MQALLHCSAALAETLIMVRPVDNQNWANALISFVEELTCRSAGLELAMWTLQAGVVNVCQLWVAVSPPCQPVS